MSQRRAVLMVLFAAVLWGTTGTARAFASDAPPAMVGAVRIAIGGAVLVAIALARGTLLSSRWPPAAVALCALAVAGYQLSFFAGVARAGVAVGTIIAIGSAPAFAGLFSWLALREPPTARWLAATAAAVVGLVLLVLPSNAATFDATSAVLPLAAGASYAIYATASKRLVRVGDSVAVAAIAFGGGALLLSPLLFIGDLRWLSQPSGVAVALELGLLATVAAYLLFTSALAQIPVSWAATLSLAEPLTASVLGVLVLRESLEAPQLAGAALVLVGLVVLATARPPAASGSS
jgi:DME family drug/metabolite transporter